MGVTSVSQGDVRPIWEFNVALSVPAKRYNAKRFYAFHVERRENTAEITMQLRWNDH
jgi:hypothetical protein